VVTEATAAGSAGSAAGDAASRDAARRGAVRLTKVGLWTNALLAAAKLVGGIAGHSYALVADALESLTDVAGSAVVLGGLRIAELPPDKEHPYGHGKAEPLAALIVSGILGVAGVLIAVEAVQAIASPHGSPRAFTLWVLLGVVVVKAALYLATRRAAAATESVAVGADASHHWSDAATSVAAGVGITISLVGGPGYEAADAWAALAASVVVLWNAWRLFSRPLHELMDAAPGELVERVGAAASRVEGVAEVEKVLARKSGPRYLVDMHIHVSPTMSVREAHSLAGRVKATVRAELPEVADVLIHVEPAEGK
jgi:cation diffusion facilitator family transporter